MTDPVEPAAVPEPIDEAVAPRRRRRLWPERIGGVFYLGVLAASGTAFLVIVLGDWRVGVRVLASALIAAGVLRLVLRQDDAGMLAVRRRSIDVLLLLVVGTSLWWLAGSIPDQP
ncbi:DUF3017 domain-containing protein [Nocardioides plantarum]|uniref:DUF3017 domain-containing protein n=1 Tax=Nocardioides plantarum TaxID=29299 RepID=A0ABV5KAJ3_9ACTN|nr:DUF3017 domain-containing protein [Nocardioides plantarum]